MTDRCENRMTSGLCNMTSSSCGNPTPFADPREYDCQDDVCIAVPYRHANDMCTTAADCYTGTCTAGVCVGKAVGVACDRDYECMAGHYCNEETNVCAAQSAENGVCVHGGQCRVPFTCAYPGKCVLPFSVADGSVCMRDSVECLATSFCRRGNSSMTGICTPRPTTEMPCNRTIGDACRVWGGYDASCSCNPAGNIVCQLDSNGFATSKASECSTQLRAMGTCLETNQCVYYLTSVVDPATCAQMKCKNEIGCAMTCVGTSDAYAAAVAAERAAGCTVPSLTFECDDGSSAAALFVGLVVLLALLF